MRACVCVCACDRAGGLGCVRACLWVCVDGCVGGRAAVRVRCRFYTSTDADEDDRDLHWPCCMFRVVRSGMRTGEYLLHRSFLWTPCDKKATFFGEPIRILDKTTMTHRTLWLLGPTSSTHSGMLAGR